MSNENSANTPITSIRQLVTVTQVSHGWNVAGALLIGAAIGAAGYALAQKGLLDDASVFVAAFILAFSRAMFAARGLRDDAIFRGTRAMVAQIRADAKTFAETRSVAAKAVMALGSALLLVVTRHLVLLILSSLSNVWFAASFGCAVAAAVAAPTIFSGVAGSLRAVVAPTGVATPAAPATPAPAATTTPVEEAPAAPAVVVPTLEPEDSEPR